MSEITPKRRRDLAELHSLSDGYLYQCLTGRRDMEAKEAVRVELLTNGELTRQMLRPNDYWLIWPDLKAPKAKESVNV